MTTISLTLDQAVAHFAKLPDAVRRHLKRGGKKATQAIVRTAQLKIGRPQPAVGPFPEWPPLAERTLEDKARLGYKGDGAPLLRTAEMRESIGERAIKDMSWQAGSDDPTLIWQDQGTSDGHVPPRPVLGPAAIETMPRALEILGTALLDGLEGKR